MPSSGDCDEYCIIVFVLFNASPRGRKEVSNARRPRRAAHRPLACPHRARDPRTQPPGSTNWRSSASARRGVPLAQRLAHAIHDINQPRDPDRRARHHALPRRSDAHRGRGAAARPPHRDSVLDRRQAHPAGRRRAVYRADDPRGARRADRVRPAEGDSADRASSIAATASCRSRPTTSARTCRRRCRRACRSTSPRSTAATKWRSSSHEEGSAQHRRPDQRRDLPDSRHRRSDARDRPAADQESADAARQDRSSTCSTRPSTRTRTSFEIAEKRLERRHAEHRRRDVERARRARRSSIRR